MTRSPERGRMRRFAAACALALAAAIGAAQADDAYPSRPITIVVPFSPGSATDTSARILTEKLGPRLGVPIMIENKPGASGTLGSSTAARAAPDGYTLILSSSSTHSATPALFRKLPYDPTGDFIHLIRIATIPMMLVLRADSPYDSVSQLVQATRAQPLNYAYGSPTSQIAGATFNHVAGAAANPVPYKSQPPAVTDLLGGHVDYLFADLSVVTSFMHGGKLKGIAFTGPTRSKDFPDVPTLTELGYQNFNLVVWLGLAAPKGTPAPVVERLNREITRLLHEPDSIAKFETLGMQVAPNTLAEHQTFVQSQRQIWTQRAIDAKIEPQ